MFTVSDWASQLPHRDPKAPGRQGTGTALGFSQRPPCAQAAHTKAASEKAGTGRVSHARRPGLLLLWSGPCSCRAGWGPCPARAHGGLWHHSQAVRIIHFDVGRLHSVTQGMSSALVVEERLLGGLCRQLVSTWGPRVAGRPPLL